MASLWTNAGKIVTADGSVVICDDCPCGVEQTFDCDQCPDGMPKCWEIAVAGIENDPGELGGNNCENYNGTFVLENQGGCAFTGPAFFGVGQPPDCADDGVGVHAWTMRFESGNNDWFLRTGTGGGHSIAYERTSGDPCAGDDVVFSFLSETQCCQNYPATITATPVNCP